MRASLACALLVACGGEAAPAPPPPTPPERAPEVAPPPMPAPTGRSIVMTERPWSMAGVAPDVELLVERARQRAAECHAHEPSPRGVMELVIVLEADGRVGDVRVTRDEPGSATLVACIRAAISALRARPAVVEIPLPSIQVTWRFAVIDASDPLRDCVFDAECGLVTGLCEGPVAVRRGPGEQVDRDHRAQAAVVRCAETTIVPVVARCREGYCEAIEADMADLRRCASASECAVIERRCGWDTVSARRRREAESIVEPESRDLVCDTPRGPAPTPVCAAGFCTLEWAASAPP